MNRYFPIKTETACQLKWTWSTVRLYNGVSSSCHRVDGTVLSPETFVNFHNTDKQIADRKLMLQGQWPTGGCEYCQKVEQAGGQSDRLFHLQIPNYVPLELDHDPGAVHVTPRILEVYFDNVCNMACIYCWDGFSSKIHNENLKFGEFDVDGVVIKNSSGRHPEYSALSEQLWIWLEANCNTLARLNVLGGEPFYQSQFDQLLDFLERHNNSNLELGIVSNLKINQAKLIYYVERIKRLVQTQKISRLDITCSIDCFGPEQEYVRHGIDLHEWKQNFEYLATQEWIVLNINQTLSALTIKTMPDMLRYLYEFDREIGHYFSTTVMTYEFLHPRIFGPGFFDKDFENVVSSITKTSWQANQARQNMLGLWKEINAGAKSPKLITQLGTYLTELDRRRGTNWKQTFPWLEQEIQNVVQ